MVEESVQDEYTQEESRKRPSEDQGNEVKTKRYNAGGNQPLLKLLVPNYAAGALIGKGGTVIAEMQNKFGGNIRLSGNREYYPGTGERVVVLTGEINQIIDLNNHVMEKVQGDPTKQPEMRPKEDGRSEKVKIVLTNAAAGMLIGRGGSTIKAIQEESKAKISICSLELSTVPGERVLTMSGTIDQRMEGCKQVIEKISGDASNMANTTVKYMNASMGMTASHESNMGSLFNNRQQQDSNNLFSVLSGNPMAALQGASNMGLSHQSGKSKLKAKVEIQVEVPDVMVGAILGKQGQIIRELAQRSGARFKFSDKNEYAAGTTDRILTITGDINQTQTAYSLINERVEQLGNQLNNR